MGSPTTISGAKSKISKKTKIMMMDKHTMQLMKEGKAAKKKMQRRAKKLAL